MDAAVIKFTVDKLGNALIEETLFLLDVRSQFKKLRVELIRMQSFLKDADAKQQGDERVRNWVADIRNVAYDAEDVIDTFVLKIDAAPKSGGFQTFKWKALMFMNLQYSHRIGRKIQDILSTLEEINVRRVQFGITNLPDNTASSSTANQMIQHPLRNYYPHVEDKDVIGLEMYINTLLIELKKDDERRCIVSIVGIGGVGKTTLAKKIYKHDDIMNRFDCRAWCSISQQLNLGEVLLKIIKDMMKPKNNDFKDLKEEALFEILHDYLQDKQYFVVVDDLWRSSHWSALSAAFPDGKAGSKVLITTRNKTVASGADSRSLKLELQPLTVDDSWELFCKKTGTNAYSVGVEELGREMVGKCGGLPLAICALGGLLSTKSVVFEDWEYVNKAIASNINESKDGGVMGILALSYNDLPVHLKACFIYLGLFPEDFAIPRKKLVQL